MPITVQHGPNQSRYASIMAQSAKKTTDYTRLKEISEFMQQVKQGNREYELGKEQNTLTGRGQDITRDLGTKDLELRDRLGTGDLDLRNRLGTEDLALRDRLGTGDLALRSQGLDLQKIEGDRNYELGKEDVKLKNRGYDLQEVNQDRMYSLGLREQDLAELTQKQAHELGLFKANNDVSIAREGYFMQNPNRAMNLYGADPVHRDSNYNIAGGPQSIYSQLPRG